MAVFREYPYLYEGDAAYEGRYLQDYAASSDFALVVARDGDRVVGASTALPLLHEHNVAVQQPFKAAGFDLPQVLYLGESVLQPEYRGLGIGARFFDEREAHARELGLTVTTFCAVERAPDDPRRPAGYVPLGAFWHKRGYQMRPDLVTTFSWKEVGGTDEVPNRMVFWLKHLDSTT